MEVRFDESETVVIDIGSGFIKAGYSGEDLPRVVIPTVIAEKHVIVDESNQNGESKQPKTSHEFGNAAFAHRGEYELNYPV